MKKFKFIIYFPNNKNTFNKVNSSDEDSLPIKLNKMFKQKLSPTDRKLFVEHEEDIYKIQKKVDDYLKMNRSISKIKPSFDFILDKLLRHFNIENLCTYLNRNKINNEKRYNRYWKTIKCDLNI